jgi:N-glycosylase/DNA lyase
VGSRDLGRSDTLHARKIVARMLRLDETLDPFYARARRVARPDLRWTERVGAGRLLRSPTVFEDLVKMICTTNCSWALTRIMTRALVSRLGEEAPGGHRLFPTPEAMASAPRRFYRDVVKAGYRGPFLLDLARSVSRGAVATESWIDPGTPTGSIREEILAISGAGPYVADNMLKLLGRYEGLGIDSWCRRTFSRMYRPRRPATDSAIGRFYEPFGPWRGLALWCDMTRDWFDDHGHPRGQDKFPGLGRDEGR